MDKIEYMVIGKPVRHSLSPVMQNAAFELFGEGSPYGFRELEETELPAFADFARSELKGFNITAPYKRRIMELCDVVTEEAREAESVNTVKNIGGKLYGYTTDGFGFREAMRTALGLEPEERDFAILGAGGAASAIARELAADGAKKILIVNRTLEKAQLLAGQVGGEALGWNDLDRALDADCVINCTTLGLKPGDPSPLSREQLAKCRAVFDTVYLSTALQRTARELKTRVAGGKLMLLYQGARAFEVWTGHAAPVIQMQRALEKALEERKNE